MYNYDQYARNKCCLLCIKTMLLTCKRKTTFFGLIFLWWQHSCTKSSTLCPSVSYVTKNTNLQNDELDFQDVMFPKVEGTSPFSNSSNFSRNVFFPMNYNRQNFVYFSFKRFALKLSLLGNLAFPIHKKDFTQNSWQIQFRIYTKQLH